MNSKVSVRELLIAATHDAVKAETTSTTNVVRHFREIFDRDIHLDCGFPSMFMMAVEEFGYDKQSAQRRVNAMTLSIAVPGLLEMIDEGQLCLQSAADIQTFLNKEQGAKRPYSIAQKKELVAACSGKSTREVQIELACLNPEMDFRESKKHVSKDRIQVTHTMSTTVEAKIERIKNLLSHVNPYMSREEVLDFMAERTLDAIDPLRKAERAEKRKAERKVEQKIKQNPKQKHGELTQLVRGRLEKPVQLAKVTLDESREPVSLETDSFSAQRMNFAEVVEPETGEIQLVATFEERTRAIAAEEDHEVWLKNNDEGCVYVDPVTGRRCGAKHQAQRDHILEFSRGGSNTAENLQLMCAQHNRFRWRRRSRVREVQLMYA